MRITSVLVAVGASLMLAVTACGGPVEVDEVSAAEPVQTDEQMSTEQGTVTAMAICSRKWTCWNGFWYSTQTACTTACGGATCEQDYYCNGSCVCP
jgi:hypothetical protein